VSEKGVIFYPQFQRIIIILQLKKLLWVSTILPASWAMDLSFYTRSWGPLERWEDVSLLEGISTERSPLPTSPMFKLEGMNQLSGHSVQGGVPSYKLVYKVL
jgi:hypothetical protein